MNTQSPPPDSVPPQPQAPQPQDPRRRLRELLSIPERDRTDEQWDEIVELEIQTAPGNRITPLPGGGGGHGGGGRQPQQQKKSHFKGQGGRQKPRKPNNPGNQ